MILSRCCIACKTRNEKSKLFRIVTDNNVPKLDIKQKENTRGMYICKNEKCIAKAIKLIEKNKLKTGVSVDIDSLKQLLLTIKPEG